MNNEMMIHTEYLAGGVNRFIVKAGERLVKKFWTIQEAQEFIRAEEAKS